MTINNHITSISSHSMAFYQHDAPIQGGQQKNIKTVPAEKNLDNPPIISKTARKTIASRTAAIVSAFSSFALSIKVHGLAVARIFKLIHHGIRIISDDYSDEAIVKAAASFGGITIKFLQNLSTIISLLSDDNDNRFHKLFSEFSNAYNKMPTAELKSVLGKTEIPFDKENFTEIVQNLGSGSVADVNKLRLENDKNIAVKVISNAKKARILADFKVIKFVMLFLAPRLSSKRNINPYSLKKTTAEFIEGIKKEFNLENETNKTLAQAQALTKAHTLTSGQLAGDDTTSLSNLDFIFSYLPSIVTKSCKNSVVFKSTKIIPEFSSKNVMAMEEINGLTISQHNAKKIAELLKKHLQNNPDYLSNVISGALSANLRQDFPRTSDLVAEETQRPVNSEALAHLDKIIANPDGDESSMMLKTIKSIAFFGWLDCFYKTGFYNADIHDGNIMIGSEDDKLSIYFIDHGNAYQLEDNKRKAFIDYLFTGFSLNSTTDESEIDQKAERMVENLKVFGQYKKEVDWDAYKNQIQENTLNGQGAKAFASILQHPIYIPAEISGFLKVFYLNKDNLDPIINLFGELYENEML